MAPRWSTSWITASVLAIAGLGLSACDGCAFVPCDGLGYMVWATNESDEELRLAFQPSPDGPAIVEVAPGTVDGHSPWVYVDFDENGSPLPGTITVFGDDCAIITTFSLPPGEYRLHLDDVAPPTLSAEDVPNDLDSDPLPATSEEC